MNKQRGFTLIELMIAIAIVAILTAIAAPIYTEYIIRGQLSQAHAGLNSEQVRIEQFFMDNRTYVGSCLPVEETTTYWSIGCPVAPTPGVYTIVATPTATGPAGFTFNLTNVAPNFRNTVTAPAGWASGATCWVVRKGAGAAAC